MRVALIDVETTGLTYNRTLALNMQPHVIEFYGLLVKLQKQSVSVLQELALLVKPPMTLASLPPQGKKTIVSITGIDDAMLKNAPPFAAVANQIFNFIEAAPMVLAHNATFDKEMLDIEADRLGRKIKWPTVRCSVEQTIHLTGQRLTLQKLHQHLCGEPFTGAHRARTDVHALLACAQVMHKGGMI